MPSLGFLALAWSWASGDGNKRGEQVPLLCPGVLHALKWTLLGTGCPVVCRKHRGCTKSSHNKWHQGHASQWSREMFLRRASSLFPVLREPSRLTTGFGTSLELWEWSALRHIKMTPQNTLSHKRPVPQTLISPPRFYDWHFATFTLLLNHLCAHLFIHPSNLSTNPP